MPSEHIRWPRKSTVGATKVHLSGLRPSVVHVPSYFPKTQTSPPCISDNGGAGRI